MLITCHQITASVLSQNLRSRFSLNSNKYISGSSHFLLHWTINIFGWNIASVKMQFIVSVVAILQGHPILGQQQDLTTGKMVNHKATYARRRDYLKTIEKEGMGNIQNQLDTGKR